MSTADNTLSRKASICAGDPNGADAFDPSIEWDGFAADTLDGLGAHTATCSSEPPVDAAPSVVSVSPSDGAIATPGQNITVTFSEPVSIGDGAFSLTCSETGVASLGVSGGPTTFSLTPDEPLVNGDECSFLLTGTAVTDDDLNDPPDTMAADFTSSFTVADVCTAMVTAVPAIQGSGATSPLAGQTVTTRGVVVGDYEGPSPTLRGFYIQDPEGDGDPETSDAIFVFNGNSDSVDLGDLVAVTGSVAEFQDQTQISASSVVECGTGVSVAPTEVTLPVATADYLERYEGMLVTFPQMLFVTEHFQLGRFGQVVVSSGGRLQQPTNVFAPGDGANALQARNNLNRLIIDDDLQSQNPDPIVFARGGQPLSASNTLRVVTRSRVPLAS